MLIVTAQVVKPVNRDDLPTMHGIDGLKNGSPLGVEPKSNDMTGPTGLSGIGPSGTSDTTPAVPASTPAQAPAKTPTPANPEKPSVTSTSKESTGSTGQQIKAGNP